MWICGWCEEFYAILFDVIGSFCTRFMYMDLFREVQTFFTIMLFTRLLCRSVCWQVSTISKSAGFSFEEIFVLSRIFGILLHSQNSFSKLIASFLHFRMPWISFTQSIRIFTLLVHRIIGIKSAKSIENCLNVIYQNL